MIAPHFAADQWLTKFNMPTFDKRKYWIRFTALKKKILQGVSVGFVEVQGIAIDCISNGHRGFIKNQKNNRREIMSPGGGKVVLYLGKKQNKKYGNAVAITCHDCQNKKIETNKFRSKESFDAPVA